ncbi:hypothetical protein [Ectopseudomonas hydrolytica]|uniref:hypothetical protein n=1 Tax=Ectopseudomonas hydrolytica TaxID=2493633 RepID=UPI003C2B8224
MHISRSNDILLAAIVSLAVVWLALINGDALYLGIWYYFAVPIVILGACAALNPAPLFLTGTSLGIAISLLCVMSVNWGASRPEGLLGLGHLFSLPGAIISAILTASLVKRKFGNRPLMALSLGLSGLLIGYFINQIIVCNSVMWCGPLSLSAK